MSVHAEIEHPPWATRRIDSRLVAGRGRYVGTVSLDGQLWAGVVRSPVAHGRLVGVDAREARRLDGVCAVLTAADLGAVPFIPGPPRLTTRSKLLHSLAASVPPVVAERVPRLRRQSFSPALNPYRQPVLAVDRVRYVGEPLALVVAEDPYVVEDAVELVAPDIVSQPAATRADDPNPAPIWPKAAGNELFRLEAAFGDAAACFARADHVVTADFALPRQTGLPMECRGLVAEWVDGGQTLLLWGPTKTISFTRAKLAELFRMPLERIVCHAVDVGGMFGVRGEFYPEDFLVPWAARVTGRPVKWVEDRREHLVATNHSREQQHHVSLALRADGRLLALRDEIRLDLGAYVRPAGNLLAALTARALPGPYRWEAMAVQCHGVATNKTPVGPMRGPGETEATFVRERALDIAAAELGLDPVELRRRNLLTAADGPWSVDLGDDLGPLTYDHDDYRALFEQFLDAAEYPRHRNEAARRRRAGEDVGVGVACFVAATGSGPHESATVELTTDGRFRVASTAVEVGQGLTDMVAAVAARALGVDPGDVEVVVGDSSAHPGGIGTFSSRSTVFLSGALADGAEQLIDRARERAAEMLGTEAAKLSPAREGMAAGDELVSWKELAPITVTGTFHPNHGGTHLAHGFGAHLAVAHVDGETSEARVEDLVVGYDCGDAVDEGAVRGQLIGGAVLGLGGTLFEALVYDDEGQPTSATLIDYLIPTWWEVGRTAGHLLAPEDRPAGTALRGAGEAGVLGVAPAVTNAVAAALGLTDGALTALPLTPDALLEARTARLSAEPRTLGGP